MRVALLSPNARAGDAIGRQLVEKAAYFADRGAAVRLIVSDARGIHPALRPYVIRQTSAEARGPGWSAAQTADLVVVEYPYYYALLDWLPLLADGQRRIVFDYHGVTPARYTRGPTRDAVLRGKDNACTAGFGDVVLCHSAFAVGELAESAMPWPSRLRRASYAIDTDWFCPAPPSVSLRDRLGLDSAKVVLFVGRLAPNKRVPVLIAAIAGLRDLNPAVHAVVVGASGDWYEAERTACQELAADRGVADRLHFLGVVDDVTLRDCYRSADVFVMPSVHEGFCVPAVEAMACGLPVIVARAGALPETVGDAGLTFAADDADDLALQIRRVLTPETNTPPVKRVAVVSTRVGDAVAGGAERSLTRVAEGLAAEGYAVGVFATSREGEVSQSVNTHMIAAEPVDGDRRASAAAAIAANPPAATWEMEAAYFGNTTRASALQKAMTAAGPFDAVIAGPCVNGLTREIVRRYGRRTVLVPCLHDEPLSRMPAIQKMFTNAGAVWYHSEGEKTLAEAALGLNHPCASVVGTCVAVNCAGDATRGRRLAGDLPYLVYCGRLNPDKGLIRLVDFARRYAAERPGRLRLVVVGEGSVDLPAEPWLAKLGRLGERDKYDVIAGAVALVQLSDNESLSLVVLEACALGVPFVVNADNPVLVRHAAAGGGMAVSAYAEYARAVEELAGCEAIRQKLSQAGRDYVVREFGSSASYRKRLADGLRRLATPLPELMKANGLRRAARFCRPAWRAEFERAIDAALDAPPVGRVAAADFHAAEPVVESPAVRTWPLVLTVTGNMPLVPTGPGRCEVVVRLRSPDGEVIGGEWPVRLPRVVAAGDSVYLHVPLPENLPAGAYGLEPGLRCHAREGNAVHWHGPIATWHVAQGPCAVEQRTPMPRGGSLRKAVSQARDVQTLPDGYVDVSAGFAGRWKRWAKQKLLNNFRAAYVDVMSRQQSQFNRRVVDAVAGVAAEADALRADLDAVRGQLVAGSAPKPAEPARAAVGG